MNGGEGPKSIRLLTPEGGVQSFEVSIDVSAYGGKKTVLQYCKSGAAAWCKHEETSRRRARGAVAEVGKHRRHTYCAGCPRRRQHLLCNAVSGHPHCLLQQGGQPQQRLEHDGVPPGRGRCTQRRRPREGSAAARNQTRARGWNHHVVGGAL